METAAVVFRHANVKHDAVVLAASMGKEFCVTTLTATAVSMDEAYAENYVITSKWNGDRVVLYVLDRNDPWRTWSTLMNVVGVRKESG